MITIEDLLSDSDLNSISDRIDEIEVLLDRGYDEYLEELDYLQCRLERSMLYIELEAFNLKNKKRRIKNIILKAV